MISIGILLGVTVLLIFYLIQHNRKWKKLPPGPVNFPIVGSLIQMNLADSVYPHKALAKMSKKYGPVMSIGFGVHPAVVVSSFDDMKELFKKDEASSSRFQFPYVSSRNFNKNLGVIWSAGLMWRDMRRYSVKILKEFGFGKSKSMEMITKEVMDEAASNIRESSQKNNGIFQIDQHSFTTSQLNILWSLVAGYRFAHDDKKLHRNLEISDTFSEVIGPKNVYNFFPFLKTWFPKWSQHERHVQINKEIQNYMKELIAEIKEKRSMRLNSKPECFIEVFLDEIEKNSSDPNTAFTEEQLIIILMDLFLAGSITTASTFNWAILFLTLNPRVQQKVQQELQKVASESTTKTISIQDFARMPYMKATVLEILRLGDSAPIPSPRLVTEDIKYKDYVIPKGTAMFMNFEPVFQDEIYWGDPKNFRPERFLNNTEDEINNERAEKISVFGFGKRVCLSESLALDTIFMFISTMFTNFTFESIPGMEPTAENPSCALMLYPRPYSVRVRAHT